MNQDVAAVLAGERAWGIAQGDCLEILPTIPQGVARLAYFDPPFNIGLSYPGYNDNRPRKEYFAWLEVVLQGVIHALTPDGSIWVQCGQTVQADIYRILQDLGLHWRNTVIWHYTFGPHQKQKFVPSWQALHWFTVDAKSFVFNADEVREPSARQLVYNDKRANPKGRVPDDVWKISRVCGTFKERNGNHSCQSPLALVEKVIRACSNPGDVVLDPMVGTGTTCAAAISQGRRGIGIELCAETAAKARERLEMRKEAV